MSDQKPDKQNKEIKNAKGKSTLSLKNLSPKTLNKSASSETGLIVEHRQKRRTHGSKSKQGGSGRSPLSLKGNNNNAMLSKAEQDARNRALSIAKQYQAEEAAKDKELAETQKFNESLQATSQDIPEVLDDKSNSEPVKPQEDEVKLPKKNSGPRVLGQVDLNRFAPSKKKTARLEGHEASSRGGGRRDTNRDNPRNGDQRRGLNNRPPQDQNRDRPQERTSSTQTPRSDFSNQRANFTAESMALTSKSPSRKSTKFKSKPNFEESDSQNAAKKGFVINKDRSRKMTILNALDDDGAPTKSMAAHRRRLNKRNKSAEVAETQKVYREVTIPDTITVQELASRMSERSADVVKELMKLGIMATLNQVLDAETAELIVDAMGHNFVRVSEADVENILIDYQDSEESLMPRAPIVTIMGHVDHGKTSLLDALRKTNVVSGEAGGITQHIGAYKVRLEDGRGVTFIDTPGHAAFSEMRSRGAKVTDIVILVVAADDGVKPQTIEAINHAKAAEVPMIIAINKIDKPGADPARVRNELLHHEIIVESLGGDTLEVEVSAKEGTGLDVIIDTLLLQAEIMDLKANPDRYAQGIVVEAELSRGRGPVATVLIQHGQLRVGDILVAGAAWGRVRALQNDLGQRITEAGPSDPVEVLGLASVPLAGDSCYVMENDAKARDLAEYREEKLKAKVNLATAKTLDGLMSQIKASQKKSLPIVIKGDVQGSVEAIAVALNKIGNDEVQVQIVHSGAGGITESDINLAEASGGIVFGFNVRANKQARDLAENRKIEIRYYAIIYDLINDVKDALSGMLKPELKEKFLGNAEIIQVFDITKVGKVAGCRIREGMAKRSAKVRLIRDDVVIHEGVLSTLRRFKDEVKEVQQGYECGMAFENYSDMRENDTIEVFEVHEIARQLD